MSWKRLEVGGQWGSCCQRAWAGSGSGSAGETQLSTETGRERGWHWRVPRVKEREPRGTRRSPAWRVLSAPQIRSNSLGWKRTRRWWENVPDGWCPGSRRFSRAAEWLMTGVLGQKQWGLTQTTKTLVALVEVVPVMGKRRVVGVGDWGEWGMNRWWKVVNTECHKAWW